MDRNGNISRRRIIKLSALGFMGLSLPTSLIFSENALGQSVSGKRTLTLYFSRTGNTETLAKQINSVAGGDIARLATVAPYPENYNATTEQAKKEQDAGYRPPIKPINAEINSYDVIFLGYPNWWGTLPMAYFTFLEANELSGKIIAPFCTHEGSYLGNGVRDLHKLCPASTVTEGYALRGRSSDSAARRDIAGWFKTIGLA